MNTFYKTFLLLALTSVNLSSALECYFCQDNDGCTDEYNPNEKSISETCTPENTPGDPTAPYFNGKQGTIDLSNLIAKQIQQFGPQNTERKGNLRADLPQPYGCVKSVLKINGTDMTYRSCIDNSDIKRIEAYCTGEEELEDGNIVGRSCICFGDKCNSSGFVTSSFVMVIAPLFVVFKLYF